MGVLLRVADTIKKSSISRAVREASLEIVMELQIIKFLMNWILLLMFFHGRDRIYIKSLN